MHVLPNNKLKTRSAYWPLALVLLCMLSACFKEKNLQAPGKDGVAHTAVIDMGPNYTDQYFYSLNTNTVLSHNSRFAYDLMFDCAAGKFHIWLNTAKFMCVKRTAFTDLDSVQLSDTLHADWKFELGEFNPDSNAIGNWWDTMTTDPVSMGKVYLLQRGVDDYGYGLGFIKMKVNGFSAGAYSITFSDFVHPPQTIQVLKDATRNYRYLLLNGDGTIVDNIEPPKNEWDLCFTRYSVFFYAPYYIPYQVVGVLNNPSRTLAYLDSVLVFDSIKINHFDESRLLTRRDAIGYEWKRVSSLSVDATYSLNYHYHYFIKCDDDRFYKLRFFDFFKQGIKGYPSFEYYQL